MYTQASAFTHASCVECCMCSLWCMWSVRVSLGMFSLWCMCTRASAFTHASRVECCMRNHFAHAFFQGVIGHVCAEHTRHAVICTRLLSRRHWSRMCRTHASCSKETFVIGHVYAEHTRYAVKNHSVHVMQWLKKPTNSKKLASVHLMK